MGLGNNLYSDDAVGVELVRRLRQEAACGRVRLLEADDLRAIPGPSPHYVSVPQTIEIGRKLGLHVPTRIRVVAVEAKNMYHLGEGISAEMARTLPRILARVKDVLKNLNGPAGARKRTGPPKGRPKARKLEKNRT